MENVVIVGALRTPIGSFGGALASFSAPELGSVALSGLLKKHGVSPNHVDEVIMGNVLTANIGQAPARQAALKAGLPDKTPCTTVNKVCASGMKAVMYAVNQIQTGESEIMLAGGMESMSNVPYYLPGARFGTKLGHTKAVDGIIKDGLWDVYKDFHMGNAAEICARDMGISREDQDEFAALSYKRSQEALEKGYFSNETISIKVKSRKGDVTEVTQDEEPLKVKFDKISSLKPVFEKEGTVTAANSSTINDGAAALLVMSENKAKEFGHQPLARIVSQASAARAAEWFTTAPADAIPKALAKGNLTTEDIDLFEINEAFAVVSLANNRLLKLDRDKVNIHGGAVSLGHPIGCSGARVLVTLLHALKRKGETLGCAGICNGGGGASAVVVEMMQ
ncbi:MAG: acetyl-CoA C-acyltransferase [Balneolales bacterium]